jgi:diguanylate cyclase (GGDEF)-like protein
MQSILGLHGGKSKVSPLEGTAVFRAQQADSGLQQLARHEWWLWLSAFFVTTLSGTALLLSSFSSFFQHTEHFYEMRPEQVRWGILCLLLLFNGWLLYRQWFFRRERRGLAGGSAGAEAPPVQASDLAGMDPVTGLYTRAFIEQQLGKEIARARRQNTSLSLATIHLDEFQEVSAKCGSSAMEVVLKDLARRLKKACRGSDFAARLSDADFVLVLPECGVGEVRLVLNRLGNLETAGAGRKMKVAYTTGWVDYQPGELPSDLLKRAAQVLHLYDTVATTPAVSLR